MQSVSESKQELEASIRYAENAISSAKATIESMEFRQEMAKKQYAEQTGREQALEQEVAQLKSELDKLRKEKEASSGPCGCQAYRDLEERATMPVIPKDVAIAIFREGVQSGVLDAISELEGQTITVSETGYTGDFEVSFERSVILDDELDFDWMRDKVGQYNEEFVVGALKGLCADKEFECRIHGVDDQEEKKND
jgi:hypothetical protein